MFAVADWARSLEAAAKEESKPPPPGFKEIGQYFRARAEDKAALAAFVPQLLTAAVPDALAAHPVHTCAADYLDAWRSSNYGHMARAITGMSGATSPGTVRANYSGTRLLSYSIDTLDHYGAAVCTIRVTLDVDGTSYSPELRWVREGADGETALPNHDGEWRLMSWDVAQMARNADV